MGFKAMLSILAKIAPVTGTAVAVAGIPGVTVPVLAAFVAAHFGLEGYQTFLDHCRDKNDKKTLAYLTRDVGSRKNVAIEIAIKEGISVDDLDPESSDFPYQIIYRLMVAQSDSVRDELCAKVDTLFAENQDAQKRFACSILAEVHQIGQLLKLATAELSEITKQLIDSHEDLAKLLQQQKQAPLFALPLRVYKPEDGGLSRYFYGTQRVPFVGRDDVMRQLWDFLEARSGDMNDISWWLLTGAGGTGKSRIALELCLEAATKGYDVGFWSRSDNFTAWDRWQVDRPTLLVVDYVASRADAIHKALLKLRSHSHPHNIKAPLRFLLLERSADKDRDPWWRDFQSSDSADESLAIGDYRHATEPLSLAALDDDSLWQIFTTIFTERNFTAPERDKTLDVFKRVDSQHRPLFAALAAESIAESNSTDLEDIGNWNEQTLTDVVIDREVGRWSKAGVDEPHLNLLVYVTVAGKIEGGDLDQLATSVATPSLSEFKQHTYSQLTGYTGRESEDTVIPLEPDMLGESLVLRRILGECEVVDRNEFIVKRETEALLAAAWEKSLPDFVDFTRRACSDFPYNAAIEPLLNRATDTEVARRGIAAVSVETACALTLAGLDDLVSNCLEKLKRLALKHSDEPVLQSGIAETHLARAFAFHTQEKLDKEIADYTDVIKMKDAPAEQKAKALVNRGITFGRQGELAKAIDDYTDVIKMKDAPAEERAMALVDRGVAFGQQEELAKAIDDYTDVIKMKDAPAEQRAMALFNRGITFGQQGELAKAIADFTAIIEMRNAPAEPRAMALLNRGITFGRQGELAKAIDDYTDVIKMADVPAELRAKALVYRGITFGQQEELAKAIDDYTDVIKMKDAPAEERAMALFDRGNTFGQQGELAKEIADFTAIIKMRNAPAEIRARTLLNRGITFGRQKKPNEAIDDYTDVIAMADVPAELRAKALATRGIAFGKQGEPDEAIADFTDVIRMRDAPAEIREIAEEFLGKAWGDK